MLPAHAKRGLNESLDEMLDTQDIPAKRRRYESPAPAASPAVAAASPLVSPEDQDLDLDAAVSLPDAIELPPGDAARKRRHSGDGAGTPSDEDEENDKDAPARQRRHTAEPGFRLVIPEGFRRTIPSVVLEDGPVPLSPAAAPERRGPVIEEIPYNPLAIVPYTGPPPQVALPPEVVSSPDAGGGTSPAATPSPPSQQGMDTEGEGNGGGDGVIQMLTPLECGSMDRMGSAASMDIDMDA